MQSNLPLIANKLRKRMLMLSHKNKASHLGGALSVIDLLVVLYCKVLKFNVLNPEWSERDRFFYSKGHACTALYAILEHCNFFTKSSLDSFTNDGSYFTSHVNHKIPGVELSTGSLGHALNVACGVAMAGIRANKTWKVYCVVSDGELNEGSNWEAILFAPHHKLNNLTLIVDYNKIQSFGTTKEVLDLDLGSKLASKFSAFGWNVIEVDGHNYEEIEACLMYETFRDMPTIIIAHTIKGKGIDFMENKLVWHYKSPSDIELENAITQLNIK